jgi:type II secretory pathway component PulM
MAQGFKNRLDDLKGSFERLSPRERGALGGLAAALLVVGVLLVGWIIQSGLEEIETTNDDTRRALRDLEKHKDAYMVQRQRIAALEVRMSRTPLELNRFVETAASAVGVSIAESGEIPAVVGERYTQRGVEIKLRKVGIEQLGKLLRELENSPHIVQITSLSVNTRWNQHQDLDVEMTVSTYERRGKDERPGGGTKRGRTRDRT